jgi:hypothetical protein
MNQRLTHDASSPIGHSDTSAAAERVLIEGFRRMTPQQRLARAFSMSAALRELAEARVRATYGPGISEREVRLRVASLAIPRETMISAFGWDPDVEGM